MPEFLAVSIEGLEGGTQITAVEVTLPAGTELAGDPEITIVNISVAPSAEQLEGEGEGEAGEAEASAAEAEEAAV